MFFSTATRPTYRKIGPRALGDSRSRRPEEVGVDAARPHREVGEAALGEPAADVGRRDHQRRAGPWNQRIQR